MPYKVALRAGLYSFSKITHKQMGQALLMKLPVTFRKFSSAGTDRAAWILGIGLGLTLALQVTTMRNSDISSVYSIVASITAKSTGTYKAPEIKFSKPGTYQVTITVGKVKKVITYKISR